MPEVHSCPQGSTSPHCPSLPALAWGTLLVRFPELRIKTPSTRDGVPVQVLPKIKALSDLSAVSAHGAFGIGVLRSDRLIEVHGRNEDAQAAAYRRLCERSEGEPLVIQTVLHGPRVSAALDGVPFQAVNNRLGELGVRFSLGTGKELFRTQIRAILRGTAGHQVEIVLPMISNLHEILAARSVIDEERSELKSAGEPHNASPCFGVTIETPAAALSVRGFIPHLDSLCVPSTRLIGRTLGTDRGNDKVAHLHEAAHPAAVRSLRLIVGAADGKPVRVGGEMVNNIDCGEYPALPVLVPVLLGLGIRKLNPRPELVPAVKLLIMRTDVSEAQALAREVADMATPNEIRQRCIRFTREVAPELF